MNSQRDTLPIDWTVCELGSVVKKHRPISYGVVQTGEPIKGGVPCVRVVDLTTKSPSPERMITTSASISNTYKRTILQKGDLIFALRGDIGRVAIAGDKLVGANLTRGVALISPSEIINSEYLFQIIQSPLVKQHINQSVNGSALKEIPIAGLRKIRIPIPPLSEQEKIAVILSDWDNTIELTEKLIAVQLNRKRGLMQQLLTGKKRFRGFAGQEWKTYRLVELLEEVDRYCTWDDDELYHLASLRRRSGGLFFRESLYGREIKTKVLKTIRTGDFLISKMQVVHGAMGLTTAGFDGLKVSDSYIALNSRDETKLDIEFFNYLSQTRAIYHLALLSSYGVHIEKMTFNLSLFLREKVRIPRTLEEQRRVVAVLSACDKEIDLLKQQLDALKRQKCGLMQKLLTGQIRVKVDKDEAAVVEAG
jgi:type I restriction enzyme S subunit